MLPAPRPKSRTSITPIHGSPNESVSWEGNRWPEMANLTGTSSDTPPAAMCSVPAAFFPGGSDEGASLSQSCWVMPAGMCTV